MKFNRRTILKGLLAGTVIGVGLPPLEIFMNTHGTAYAGEGGDGFPKRFGLFTWGNGMLADRWIPTGEGDAWELSEQLMPLAAVKEQLTVLTGLRVAVPNIEPHHATLCGMLTGGPLILEGGDHTFGGPSIDQFLAAEIGQETLYSSIEFGSEPGNGVSHNGPFNQNPAEKSPLALFERLFGTSFTLPGDEPVVDPSLGLRRSVLDAVGEDIKALQGAVGSSDKARLEQHFEGIRAIEKRLAKLEEDPPNLASCTYPTTPEAEYPEIEGRPQLQEKNAIFCEIAALALACDQVRVFSNCFTKPLSNILFTDIPSGHHKLTHNEPGEQPMVNNITIQCMAGFATQIQALKNIEEGDGTLLDHCLVLATSDVSSGKIHSADEFPILLAGHAGGALKQGIHYRSTASENTSKVLLSICQAFGLNLSEFGKAEGRVTQGLEAIEV